MKLIRVSWDRDLGTFMVETGELHELSEEENAELEGLRSQLEPYGEFLNLGDLEEEEREQVFAAKKRRAELEEKGREEIIWTAKPQGEVESVVLVLQPDKRPIYVENLPPSWIEKLFKSEVTIGSPQVFLGGEPTAAVAEKEGEGFVEVPGSERLNRVRELLYTLKGKPVFKNSETYLDCVDVVDEESYVRVSPKKFLEDDWQPINEGLIEAYGRQGMRWIKDGKKSHWQVL